MCINRTPRHQLTAAYDPHRVSRATMAASDLGVNRRRHGHGPSFPIQAQQTRFLKEKLHRRGSQDGGLLTAITGAFVGGEALRVHPPPRAS